MKNTKLKCRVKRTETGGIHIIDGESYRTIARFATYHGPAEEVAQQFANRYNSHDALVEAVKALLQTAPMWAVANNDIGPAVDMGERALKLAGEL